MQNTSLGKRTTTLTFKYSLGRTSSIPKRTRSTHVSVFKVEQTIKFYCIVRDYAYDSHNNLIGVIYFMVGQQGTASGMFLALAVIRLNQSRIHSPYTQKP